MLITYVIIALLIWAAIIIAAAIKDKKEFLDDWKEIVAGSLILGVIASMGIFLLIQASFSRFIPCDTQTEEVPLYALTDNYYVNSERSNDGLTVYRYLTESDKGLQFTSMRADDQCVYFKYTDNAPRLEINTKYFRNGWWDAFFTKSGQKRNAIFSDNEYYVFHVPQNSITTELEIDLE